MKKLVTIAGLLAVSLCHAQNEFAATAFYKDFQQIAADAQNGFVLNKGEKRKSDFEELAAEYKSMLHLPLADSGKVVFPVNNVPYVVYYFEPSKERLTTDLRGLNLREAVAAATGLQLFARTETTLVNERVYSYTYFYTKPDEENKRAALYKSSIYYQDGLYYLSFEIRGR